MRSLLPLHVWLATQGDMRIEIEVEYSRVFELPTVIAPGTVPEPAMLQLRHLAHWAALFGTGERGFRFNKPYYRMVLDPMRHTIDYLDIPRELPEFE